MNNAKIWFTKEGYEKLKTELEALRVKREPTVIRLQAAREQGDLSENGAYKAARFELSDIDHNIRRVTQLLKDGTVREARQDGRVGFGNTVVLKKDEKEITYILVSKYESDPIEKKLSVESPLGQAIIGKEVGETIKASAPMGEMVYKILKIS